MKISQRFQSYRADTISIVQIWKGNNFVKNVEWVTVICTLPNNALYSSFMNIFWRLLDLLSWNDLHGENFKGA